MVDIAVLNMQIVDGVTGGVPIEGVINGITFGRARRENGGAGFGRLERVFTVTRPQDEFSNRLIQLSITGEVLDEVSILQDTFGDTSFTTSFGKFTQAVITSFFRFGNGGEPIDTIEFSFESVSFG